MREKNIQFSENAKKELDNLSATIRETLDISYRAFIDDDASAASRVEALEQIVDEMKDIMRNNHILRLQNGECSIATGFIWSDLLTNLERTSDHCSNIALCVKDASEKNMNIHASSRMIKESHQSYVEYAEKYLNN